MTPPGNDRHYGMAARHSGASWQAAIARLSTRLAGLMGWRRLGVACAAGAMSVLALAPFFFSPVLFVTLPVFVWLLDGTARRVDRAGAAAGGPARWTRHPAAQAAAIGWWFGFGYFFAGLFWIGEAFLVEAEVFAWLLPFAVTLMPAGLSLFFAGAAALARVYWKPGLSRILMLAITLTIGEWLRGHVLTGFPWNTLGYSLAHPLPLLQSAAVLGLYGLTLWTMPIFAAPLVLAAELKTPSHKLRRHLLAGIAASSVLPLVCAFSYGAMVLSRSPAPKVDGVRVRIVQPSIPQREKWQRDKQQANFQLHLDLSATGPDGRRDDLAGITHVVWPEAAMPFLPLDTPAALEAIGRLLPPRTYLMTGALRLESVKVGSLADAPLSERRAFNSFMVFGPGGGLAALYDKIHLVPFGEYLPAQSTLESIGLQQLTHMRGGFTSGLAPRPLLAIGGLPPLAALVCYEAIFPREVVQGAERPGLFVNVTNDGWFGTMTGPYQHLHQSRVRAVEQGIPLLRAANNGVSTVFDGEGRALHTLGLNVRGVIDSDLPAARPPTLYSRYGDALLIVNLLAFGLAAINFGRRRN